jgi:outer membrane protein OmpA-like peptidoglycan-associated protein
MKFRKPWNAALSLALSTLVGTAVVTAAWGQTPTTEAMIEQLKMKPSPAATVDSGTQPMRRTRSLSGTRNLTVDSAIEQETAATHAAQERPSLSLLIQFDFDSARVKAESQASLANLATALLSKELLGAKFAIEGHTDAKGRQDYNQRLSQLRADAVREFLVSKGVEGVRLASSGKGSSDPTNVADPQAAENRRVKIVNLQ